MHEVRVMRLVYYNQCVCSVATDLEKLQISLVGPAQIIEVSNVVVLNDFVIIFNDKIETRIA